MQLDGLPRAVAEGEGSSVQLSDRSSIHSMSIATDDGEDPLKRLTLQQSQSSSVNRLYDSSQRDALAMFYLNESTERSTRDDDSSE